MLTGQILLQLIIILIVVQPLGFLSQRIGQQWVIGEILAGLALGPSLLGWLLPGVKAFLFPASVLPTLQTLGDIGLILYMFSLGAHIDLQILQKQRRNAIVISLSGILYPFILGLGLGLLLYARLAGPKATFLSFLLFVATAMSITAFPVLARLLTEKNMLGTRVGVLALTCASIDDVVAWCLLAFVVAITHAQGIGSVLLTLGATFLFVCVMFFAVRPLLTYLFQKQKGSKRQFILCILLLLLSAYATNAIGIHPIFGAFIAGIILPRDSVVSMQIRSLDTINGVLFLPLFFVYSGLQTQIGQIQGLLLWLICLLIIVVACSGKLLGGAVATRMVGESWRDAFSVGVLMNTRGLVELIVLNIGLQLGVLSPALFAMLVLMAIVTTMLASPLLPLLGYKSKAGQKVREEEALEIKQPSTP